ncbi:MgtC/SapB family protein [Clostridium sp. 001]|uniref:MgtC/SapB family protein n=1 Tax=Clostridium sp. 001 TaxID=1970093 RepID=UPI001C2B938A|nr:MgtC/SapB family protein [Clostridium sp. 001]QXE19808.1 methyltransferase [Clostridium sp. 001]
MGEWEMILRLLLSGVLGALIGFERRSHSKQAGLRTHFVVAVGSALIMLVSKYGFWDLVGMNSVSLDPSRVAAQVVSGVGFLGAGTIIVEHQFVRGLTTAAGLWATAGIGIAIGAGMYIPGVGATVLIVIGLEIFNKFQKNEVYSIGRANLSEEGINSTLDILKNSKMKISNIQVNRHHNKTNKDLEARITFKIYTRNQNEMKDMMVNLLRIPYVRDVNIE